MKVDTNLLLATPHAPLVVPRGQAKIECLTKKGPPSSGRSFRFQGRDETPSRGTRPGLRQPAWGEPCGFTTVTTVLAGTSREGKRRVKSPSRLSGGSLTLYMFTRMDRRVLRKWRSEVKPILTSLVEAEAALLSALELPGATLGARCDQVSAAADRLGEWLGHHPCPDEDVGRNCEELRSACAGLAVLMSYVAAYPAGMYGVDRDLMEKLVGGISERITVSQLARRSLRLPKTKH